MERIKPGSIKLSVTIGSVTFNIRDDEDGNLYDSNHSASYATFKTNNFEMNQGIDANGSGSGSEVGNVFYEQGLLSLQIQVLMQRCWVWNWTIYLKVSRDSHFINEHEYRVTLHQLVNLILQQISV